MTSNDNYTRNLRLIKSLLIVTSLQKKDDIKARKKIEHLSLDLSWKPIDRLMIDKEVWEYIIQEKLYDPKLVFCHPDILLTEPTSSLYYRGLSGLSKKAASDYIGTVDSLEKGNPRARLNDKKALKMSQTYNTFICSVIKNSVSWTLQNGYRSIIANIGITLDGKMRNKVGDMAEERIRLLIVKWLWDNNLIVAPDLTEDDLNSQIPNTLQIRDDIEMVFCPEPDIAFYKNGKLIAIIEIKGGTDPAGALERYGAAKKSFESAISESRRCKILYLAAVFTPELKRRIKNDRLVEKYFDIISILEDSEVRNNFLKELFHYTLRVT
ncbi:MAG: XcyI family restriction endonuclease [Candidatus Marinimicrobia bacterium]|nr:XcyI family restriction endonuclease [Candidatus Neomarinimicrobiota bacterium]